MTASRNLSPQSTVTVITDAAEYARSLLADPCWAWSAPVSANGGASAGPSTSAHASLLDTFFPSRPLVTEHYVPCGPWRYLVVSGFSSASQYDRLIRLARGPDPLPDGLACVARAGRGFQGFHGRSWVAVPGNLHLSVHLAPGRRIERFETVFMALAAVSVVEAIDATADLRGAADIRWVNDIVIEGAKVAGVLAYTQTRGDQVTSVVLGIGVNVETRPVVPPTAFVPEVASLRDFSRAPSQVRAGAVLSALLDSLGRNYELLLSRGWAPLMERYRERSDVVGREVEISWDEPDEVPRVYARGRVASISDGMELLIEGIKDPIRRGRLILPRKSQRPVAADVLTANFGMAS